jgi:hypothetical protein
MLNAHAPSRGDRINMYVVMPVMRTTDSILKRKNHVKSPAIALQSLFKRLDSAPEVEYKHVSNRAVISPFAICARHF